MVSSVAIEGDTVVSGSHDKTIKLWSLKTQKELISLDMEVASLAYDNNILMVTGYRGVVRFLDMTDIYNPKNLNLILDAKSRVVSLAMRGGKFVFSSSAGDLYVDSLGSTEVLYDHLENSYSIKTLLLGDSGVGKTTLGNWLEYGEYDESIVSTHGMHFFRYTCPKALNVKVATQEIKSPHRFMFDLWDFGGQPTYQIAHKQNFDNARVVFLVVDMSREAKTDNSVNYWINSIKEHKSVMRMEQLRVFVIGTKSLNSTTDTQRVKEIAATVRKEIGLNQKDVKSLLFDVSNAGEVEKKTLLEAMEKYVEECVVLEKEHVLDGSGLRVLEVLHKLRQEKFYIKDKEMLKEEVGDVYANIEGALKVLSDDGMVEMMGDYIILRPYWKNIFTTTILEYAQHNVRVSASISMDDLLSYHFRVRFNKALKSEKSNKIFKSDEELYFSEFEKAEEKLKKMFITTIIKRLLGDKITYVKNGMFVFPSRFLDKKGEFDTSQYHKLPSIALVSKSNVEVTIGKLIVSLYYSKEYTILKHLSKGVKLEDSKKNTFLMTFGREDVFKNLEKQNQESTSISLYAKNDNEGNDKLITFVKMILQDNNSLIYETKQFKIKDKEGKVALGELELTLKEKSQTKYELDGYTLEEVKDVYSYDKRMLHDLEENIENAHKAVLEKIDKFGNVNEGTSHSVSILHLSDLHFGADTHVKKELTYLKQGVKVNEIDYIVLSGDLTARATPEDFTMISYFLSELIAYFGIDAQKVIVIPGNHDYSREITHNAYSIETMRSGGYNAKVDYKVDDRIYLKRDSTKWKHKFKYFSEYLYESLYHQSYSEDVAKQIKVLEDEVCAFVLINTSTQIDHFNPLKVEFDIDTFIEIQEKIGKDKVKIAVGHHPLNHEMSYKFSANLSAFDYIAYMHGHVHRNNLISFGDMIASEKRLIQIGAGLFSNPSTNGMIPGVPLRYNIVTIDTKSKALVISTKERQNNDVPWQKSYIYPDSKGGMSDSHKL